MLKNHELVENYEFKHIQYERKPARDPNGEVVEGLFNAWIALDNPRQLNSYTTEAVKDVILAFRRASMDRSVVAAVFTATGERAFCTGGNTAEYAEVYSERPLEYRQYMRLFNDMVTAILECDKPVINRVNGMRVAGGQEIGMACDFTVAADTAVFGQAGPKHGSAPDGGSTDFLPLYVGFAKAMESGTLCRMWSAHEALRIGLINDIAPVLQLDGEFIPNPFVITDQWLDPMGKVVHGTFKAGAARAEAKETIAQCTYDFSKLDACVDDLAWALLLTFPDCTTKTIESLRKHKLEHWDRNKETNRSWLALNMMTEANLGFRAFNEAPRGKREIDFIDLRKRLAAGEAWGPELIEALIPREEGSIA